MEENYSSDLLTSRSLVDDAEPDLAFVASPRAARLTAQALDTLDTPSLPGWSLGLARLFR